MRKVMVLSGINLVDGGALSIYKDCLNSLKMNGYTKTYDIIALVNNEGLFSEFKDDVRLIAFPKAKTNWLWRLYYEYIGFKKFSMQNNVWLWLSLHDITPNVKAERRAVYCHNPSPFLKMPVNQIKYGYKLFLFSKFYRYLYKINIKKNSFVIVQQDWMRKEFMKMFDIKNIVVARPSVSVSTLPVDSHQNENKNKIFIFPSYSRFYKNFEVVCKAAARLAQKEADNFKVYLTLDGSENRYSKELVDKYHNIPAINFIGLQSRERLFELYTQSDCLIFPSKLETWGLPIIEFKTSGKPILLADLPYAHETLGSYDKVVFFPPSDDIALADLMEKIICNRMEYKSVKEKDVPKPYAADWNELFRFLTK